MNEEIGFEEIKLALLAIWKKKVLILAITILSFLAGILLTLGMKTETIYRAEATVYSVTYGKSSSSVTNYNSDNISTIVNYKDALTSQLVCEYALTSLIGYKLDVQTLQSVVRMRVQSNSYMMDIYADTHDPDLSVAIANAMADAFVVQVNTMTGTSDVQIWDKAEEAYGQQVGNPNKIRILIPVLVCMLCCAYVGIKELFTDRLRVVNQCLRAMDEEKVLGLIPYMDSKK